MYTWYKLNIYNRSMSIISDMKQLQNNKRPMQVKIYGDRAFAMLGPELWNVLAVDILVCVWQAFITTITTHYYNMCYSCESYLTMVSYEINNKLNNCDVVKDLVRLLLL